MDREERAPAPLGRWARLWQYSRESGWASWRWYFVSLIPLEVAVVMLALTAFGVGRHYGVWFVVRLALLAISVAAAVGNEVVVRRRRRAGWVPVGYRSGVAGRRTIGKWQRPGDAR